LSLSFVAVWDEFQKSRIRVNLRKSAAALTLPSPRNFSQEAGFESPEHKAEAEPPQEDTMKAKLTLAAMVLAIVAGSAGLAAAQGYPYDHDGNRYYDRDNGFRRGLDVARDFGYRDGSSVAREDMWKNKPFNPNPRGRYDGADNGYRREFGDKREYREQYSAAYRDGYNKAFRRNGYR
jgi:hypothetical protein